nr:MAG TPA: hypothetical protein [Caudoviricetes sp.]
METLIEGAATCPQQKMTLRKPCKSFREYFAKGEKVNLL